MSNVTNLYKYETHVGKKVYSFSGNFIGSVTRCENHSFIVRKKFLGFGPVVSERTLDYSEINKIEGRYIYLKPDQDSYWQFPMEVSEPFEGRYFIL